MNLDEVFKVSKTDGAICCWCGSPDDNIVTVENGLLITVTMGEQEQFFAAHKSCFLGSIIDQARTGPIAGNIET